MKDNYEKSIDMHYEQRLNADEKQYDIKNSNNKVT